MKHLLVEVDSAMKLCTVDGCNRAVYAKGWCSPHYQRAYKHGGDPTAGRPPRQYFPPPQCSEPCCERSARARGLCGTHYRQTRVRGLLDGHQKTRPPIRPECSVPGCGAHRYGHGLCQTHYMRAKRRGILDRYSRIDLVSEEPPGRKQVTAVRQPRPKPALSPRHRRRSRGCSLDGCTNRHAGHGLCKNHLAQKRRAESPKCLGPDCIRRSFGHGLCRVHLAKVKRLDALEDWDEMLAARTGDPL